ncbi:MAG: Ig-like domain-containing protein [Bacilli bacterium]|nr:Ig-like domain-containing protein [Bacilli bacterium]
MKKKIMIIVLLLTISCLPFLAKALDDDYVYVNFANDITIGQDLVYVENTEITIIDQYWVNKTDHRLAQTGEKFAANKYYEYHLVYEYYGSKEIDFSAMTEDEYCFNSDDNTSDDYMSLVMHVYTSDQEFDPSSIEQAHLDIDLPVLGQTGPVARTNSKYTISSESWYNLTDDDVMEDTSVFEEDKEYIYTVEFTTFYGTNYFLDAFDDSTYYLGSADTYASTYTNQSMSAYFYFGDKDDLVINTDDVKLLYSDPPVAGGEINFVDVDDYMGINTEGSWYVEENGELNDLYDYEVEVGKTYVYKVTLYAPIGYHFAEDFELVDENINDNHTSSKTSIINDTTVEYESRFTILAEDAQIGIAGDKHLIYSGDQLNLMAYPQNDLNQNLTWTSSNTNVATVNSSGKVTALNVGNTVITVTNQYGDSATYDLEVGVHVQQFVLEEIETTIYVGSTIDVNDLLATFSPANASNKNIIVLNPESYNGNYIEVHNRHYIEALREGTVNVQLIPEDNWAGLSSEPQTLTLHIVEDQGEEVYPTGISLSDSEITIEVGDDFEIAPIFTPAETTERMVSWDSSNENVATVEDGVVTAISAGTTTITATTINGLMATCTVTVVGLDVEEIYLNYNELNLNIGESATLEITVVPAGADPGTVTWYSYDTSVAIVNQNGVVTAVGEGSTTILVTTGNESATSCTVSVGEAGVSVTGVSLNKEYLELNPGGSETLIATVTPSDATDKTLIWDSSNTSVATVNQSGLVTAVGEGLTVITATAVNGVEGYCVVEVEYPEVETLTLNKTELNLVAGETDTLSYTVTPTGANPGVVDWFSGDQNVATVEDGVVTAVGAGTTYVNVTIENGLTATCIVNVTAAYVPVIDIYLNKTTTGIVVGETDELIATILPENATDQTIRWISSNENVATVEDGIVTAHTVGTAVITAKASNGMEDTCTVTVTSAEIPVQSVSLNKTSVSLIAGESDILVATINPSNATNTNLIWMTSNANVVGVDNTGRITANDVGTATITVQSSNNKTATCTVTVTENLPVNITLNKAFTNIEVGSSETLIATITPSNASNKTISWDSSNENVATVEDGVVTAISAGTTTITATTINGLEASCEITVTEPIIEVASIELNKTTLTLNEGESDTLVATIKPNNATNKEVLWVSSEEDIVTVEDGVVTAVNAGTALVTAITVNGKTAVCEVTVIAPVTNISINKNELNLIEGQSETLYAIIEPENATDKTVRWTSSDETVARVNDEGKVTAVGVGEATITATASNSYEDTCYVSVEENTLVVESIALSETELTMAMGQEVTLEVIYYPEGSYDYVNWSSSNDSVVDTYSDGTIVAHSPGTAIITATTVGGLTATCTVHVEEPDVEVEEITLNKTELTLAPGASEVLIATVLPDDATDKTISWESDDPEIAIVNSTGRVIARNEGTTTIRVTATNGVHATCEVTVAEDEVPVESISLNKTNLTLEVGNNETLTATITPSNATNKNITWTSSDSTIASVDSNGKVTAKKAGNVTITAITSNNKTATCTVRVSSSEIPVESITLNKATLDLLEGESDTLTVTITPSNATNKNVTWSSSDSTIASVDSEGKVTASEIGNATITVTTSNGKTATCQVTVISSDIPVTKIKLNKEETTLMVGESEVLIATLTPSNATDKTITWTSNNTNVASITNTGKITAKSAGTTMIIAKASSGKKATCFVTVTSAPSDNLPFKDVSKNSWYYDVIKTAYNEKIIAGYNNTTFGPNDKITRGQLVTLLWRMEGSPSGMYYYNRFSDVSDSQYYADAVKWAAAKDIVHGYGNSGKFGPNDPIIRQDLAVILNNYAIYKKYNSTGTISLANFVDYSKVRGGYSEPALRWAVQYKVMSGKTINNRKYLEPGSNTTRAEATAMIVNFKNAFVNN